jgi:hypothetical protein
VPVKSLVKTAYVSAFALILLVADIIDSLLLYTVPFIRLLEHSF